MMERFWAKVDKRGEGECWLWTACLRDGYGHVRHKGRSRGAHRVAYELLVGPIPNGFDIDHLCRVRHCVNPAHLEPVTRRENLLRGETIAARNAVKTRCPQGHGYTPENTRVDRQGRRFCHTCRMERQRARRAGFRLDCAWWET